MTDQLTQHREAYRAVMAAMPGAAHISHETNFEAGWDTPEVRFPALVMLQPPDGCKTCGDPLQVVGLTVKCRDLHEVCRCGARYDQPKNLGCRRRKHPKPEPMGETAT